MKQIGFLPTIGLLCACALVITAQEESRFFRITGPVPTTITKLTQDGTVTWTNVPTNAVFTVQTTTALPGNWVGYVRVPASNAVTTHRIFDPNPPSGMAFVSAGTFTMGDVPNDYPGSDEHPVHDVYVSEFHMDRTEVTNDKMVEVMQWAYEQGKISVTTNTVWNLDGDLRELLDLDSSSCRITWNGSHFAVKAAKGSGYPCVEVTWYGAVAFCNYRSQMEGFTPCYNLTNWTCNWSASAYRLPTEAEWEKAARGGLSGKRFPWGDTIDHNRANYYSYWSGGVPYPPYDVSSTAGFHPDYVDTDEGWPYSNPVVDFPPNGYGLHDMAGNTEEWCWDWVSSDYYSSSPSVDPRGPASGVWRVTRGGNYVFNASGCRAAYRISDNPGYAVPYRGFRCVRSAGQ